MAHSYKNSQMSSNIQGLVKGRIKNFVSAGTNTGAVLVKELIQNVDDAGGTRLHIILDERQLSGDGREYSSLRTPAVIVVNDAPFGQKDFEAITTVALGQKEGNAVSAGRFGVGFLSVFLVAETVLLFSSKQGILFDFNNHIIERPLNGREENLRIWDWNGASSNLGREETETFNGLIPGVATFQGGQVGDLAERGEIFNRAAFRLCLRQSAKDRHLSDHTFQGPESRKELLREMIDEASKSMVFLQNLQQIEFSILTNEGSLHLEGMCEVSEWPTPQREFLRQIERGRGQLAGRFVWPSEKASAYTRTLTYRSPGSGGETRYRYAYRFACDYDNPRLHEIAKGLDEYEKCIPWCAVAFPISHSSDVHAPWHVTLPMIDSGPSKACIHGGFFLDSNRRGPIYSREKFQSAIYTRWNEALVTELILPLFREELGNLFEGAIDEEHVHRSLRCIPQYRQKDRTGDKGVETLSEFFSSEFYHTDWSFRLLDAAGAPFELSGRDVHREGKASAIRVQEIDDLLGSFIDLLPSEEGNQRIHYITPATFEALRDRFPSAIKSWLKRARDISQDTLVEILASPKFPSLATKETLNKLVELLDPESPAFQQKLTHLHLLWSNGTNQAIRYHHDHVYIRNSTVASSAFNDLQKLGLRFRDVQQVDGSVAAGESKACSRLGIVNVLDPNDNATLMLLQRIEPGECRHDRFDVSELMEASNVINFIVRIATHTPERLNRLHLAWMICTEGGNNGGDLDSVVVLRTDLAMEEEHRRNAVEKLWETLLEPLFLHVDSRILPYLAEIHEQFENTPPAAFDEPNGRRVVRTRPNEVLDWFADLYWQRGDARRQRLFMNRVSELVNMLTEDLGFERGPESILKACSGIFSSYSLTRKHMLLYCLPVHITSTGNRVSLAEPGEMDLREARRRVRRKFRLKPRGRVSPPPGVEDEFTLLAPPDDLRTFYQDSLHIAEHTDELAVEDLLQSMCSEQVVSATIHNARLQYLSTQLPALLYGNGLDSDFSQRLSKLLSEARLVQHNGQSLRAGEVYDCPDLLGNIQQSGWSKREALELLSQAAAPRIPLVLQHDVRAFLRTLDSSPEKLEVADLARFALESNSEGFGLVVRIQVLAKFGRELPLADRPSPSVCLSSMSMPVWGSSPVELRRATVLQKWRFDLPEEVYRVFFPTAIDLGALSEKCGVSEDQLRQDVLPMLCIEEVNFPRATIQIRSRFAELWKGLNAESQLALLQPADEEDKRKTRWGLGSELLLRHGLKGLDQLEASGARLEVYNRLVELVASPTGHVPVPEDSDVRLAEITFPCQDGSFRSGDQCWPSDWYEGTVELLKGASLVIDQVGSASQLLSWLHARGLKLPKIEDIALPEATGEIESAGEGREHPSLYPWHILIRDVLTKPESRLSMGLERVATRPFNDWSVCLVPRLPVSSPVSNGTVHPSSNWKGPDCAFLEEQGCLFVRTDAVPAPSDAGKLKRLDSLIANQLVLALGVPQDAAPKAKVAILSELERPHELLEALRKEREAGLVDRYSVLNADPEFAELRSEWRKIDNSTARYREVEARLRRLAEAGLLSARREEMKELGYSEDSFYTELLQNAEDACLQRRVLNMGPPNEPILEFIRDENSITIRHYGRPFNYWRHGNQENHKYREDIDRITSDRGSFKQQTLGEQTTGRFGVGFKCVYWITDNPEIHSDVWSFRIDSTCIPVPIDPLPSPTLMGATTIRLPLLPDRKSFPLLTPLEAARLLLFTEEIQAISIKEVSSAPQLVRKEKEHLLEGSCISTFQVGQDRIARYVVIQKGPSQIGIKLHRMTGLPEPVPNEDADFYARYPMSGVRHNHGIVVSSDFVLQSGRSHLAPAAGSANEDRFHGLGSLLGSSADALLAACRGSAQIPVRWFRDFWMIWKMDLPPDSSVVGLSVHLARGLLRLATKDAVVPRFSGKLISLAECPSSAYAYQIPVKFRPALTKCIEENGRASGMQVSEDYLIDDSLASKFESFAKTAAMDSPVKRIDWDALLPVFQGSGSLFVLAPELLEQLADALILSDKSVDPERYELVRDFLRKCYIPSQDGTPRLSRELWNPQWLEQRDLPPYAYEFFPLPYDEWSNKALGLLSFTTAISWDTFKSILKKCPDRDQAFGILRFLDQAKSWISWPGTAQKEMQDLQWFPRVYGGKSRLVEAGEQESLRLRLSPEFADWLLGPLEDVRPLPPPPPTFPDGRDVLNSVREWWRKNAAAEIAKYESKLYPESFVFPEFKSMQDLDVRKSWLGLSILAVAHTLGRTKEGQHRNFLEKVTSKGWLDIFADADSTGDQWMEILDAYFEDNVTGIGYYHWLRLFAPIRCISKYLDVYVGSFDDIDGHGDESGIDKFLNTATSHVYQGTTREAPPGTQIYGIGVCYMLRELRRRSVIQNSRVDDFCFVPRGSVQRFLFSVAGISIGRHFEGSKDIAQWIRKHNEGELETFEDCFDLPFMILGESTSLAATVTNLSISQFCTYQYDGDWITLPDGRRIQIN